MDQKIAEAIGLLRHKIISPVLMESGRSQAEYFRKMEGKEFDVPGWGLKRFKASTMKGWLRKYKGGGFQKLMPKTRKDQGHYRRWQEHTREGIRKLRESHMSLSIVKFYDLCLENQTLGSPPICMATLRRFLKNEGLFVKNPVLARKRFEMSRFGELWTADYMHGPLLQRRKAILMAIIDDHSRMIVGARFGFQENTLLLEEVFKEALLTFGLCDRIYVDNGPSFSSQYLARVCAHLQIGLVHSKPYDSPSRGKIERFFRTVREDFLSTDRSEVLSELNDRFSTWIVQYHHKFHKGIQGRPVDRYQISLSQYPCRRVDRESLEEFFMVSVERTVNKDSTLRLRGVLFETPPQYIGKRVELRYSQEHPQDVYLYENNMRIQKLFVLDAYRNAKEYRPQARDPHIPFQGVIRD